VRSKAKHLAGYVDAVNVTDNQTAIVRMSSLAACVHLMQMGFDPVLQMVTRDRNRDRSSVGYPGSLFPGYPEHYCAFPAITRLSAASPGP
jgi:hypothetical protein